MPKMGSRKRSLQRLERVHRNRMLNLRALCGAYPSVREFAAQIAQAPTLYYQVAGPNPKRALGEALARDIEARLKLSEGWLDKDVKSSQEV